MRIVILGAGGHAQVIADTVLQSREAGATWEIVGFLDDDPSLITQIRLGAPILGPLAMLHLVPHDGCVIGIGNNRVRKDIFHRLKTQGEHFVTVIHPRCTIAPDVSIGIGTVIFAGVIINTGARIGANVILNTACTIDHHNSIGDHAHIAPGVHLGGDVRIGEGALIGIGATVMPQRKVGPWAVIGAGSLVHRNVPSDQIYAGVPARPLITPTDL